ncbi:spore coat protein [Bacillus carboniphilus]|uniref:Spore coat protein n=2 Tax=Bacillus carboniphilus TaxID=86663 RepID=A0ABP3GG57_9BACI
MQQQTNMTNMQQKQTTGNLRTSDQVGPQQNHGGHELFDAHEVISCLTGTIDQYVMYRQYVKDQELLNIMDRQQSFITNQYNRVVETLSTGQKPSIQATTYNMNQTHDVTYGLKPSQPKKPAQTVSDITEECVSSLLASAVKSVCTGTTMAALETTNPVLRRVFADSIPNFIELGYELFLYQNKHHYYQVPQLSMQDQTQMMQSYAPIQTAQMNQNMMQ